MKPGERLVDLSAQGERALRLLQPFVVLGELLVPPLPALVQSVRLRGGLLGPEADDDLTGRRRTRQRFHA